MVIFRKTRTYFTFQISRDGFKIGVREIASRARSIKLDGKMCVRAQVDHRGARACC